VAHKDTPPTAESAMAAGRETSLIRETRETQESNYDGRTKTLQPSQLCCAQQSCRAVLATLTPPGRQVPFPQRLTDASNQGCR
jgi:hypothetical protein